MNPDDMPTCSTCGDVVIYCTCIEKIMEEKMIRLSKCSLKKNEYNAVIKVLKSDYLGMGPVVNKFEKKLSKYLDAENVVAVNSCTAALHLTLAAKGFGSGHKFIVPTLTFASTIECGEYLGMEPVLVDSSDNSFLIDLNQIEDIVRNDGSVKAIIPVHYGGESVDLVQIMEIAEKYNLFVLQDAAHALETEYNGKKIGNTDHASAFSFYANKNLTTGGEGGALSTNDSALADRIKKLSLHGITKDGWDRYKTKGNWEYDIVELGYKYNLTDFAASFGLWQIGHIDEWQKRRGEIVQQYTDGLNAVDGILLPKKCKGHSKHLFVIQLDHERWTISRDVFIDKMNARGIGLAVHYKPLHKLSYYQRKYDFDNDCFPRANLLFQSIVSLPIYPRLSNESINHIIDNIVDLYNSHSK